MRLQRKNMPSIICSLLITSVLYVIFTMKGRGCKYCLSLSSKLLHRFISTTPLHTHHKVYDAPALTCAVVVPQVLPKVYLHTSIEVFAVGCMIKGNPVYVYAVRKICPEQPP